MALQTSGAISLANVQTEFGGVNPISISEYYGKAAGIPASGTISLSHFYGKSNGVLTLKEVVFNASDTFTMPSGVVGNQIIVGCTGGGGGGVDVEAVGSGGGPGSGRVVSTLTMSPGATATVIVGAGGNVVLFGKESGIGGASSFTGATSCGGAPGGSYSKEIAGTNGGGHNRGGYSSVAAALVLASGSTDKTSGLWTAKRYGGPNAIYGGGGCYGGGGYSNGIPNTGGGSGAGACKGGSGKVVVWYYIYE